MATKLVLKDEVPTYSDAGLGARFATQVSDYVDLKDRIKEFEQSKTKLNEKIFAQLAGSGFKKVLAREWIVSIIDTDRPTLDKKKLVEKLLGIGLDAAVVDGILAAATTTTHNAYLRVDAKKE